MQPSGGQTIEIFLVDGNPTGLMTAQIRNWNLKCTIVARSDYGRLKDRPDTHKPGVYFLVGTDEESFDYRDIVYIGESEDIFSRLANHLRDETKDFWTKTVIFTGPEGELTKSHTRYLESRLIGAALEAQRARITNGTAPEQPKLSEAARSDMELFLAQILLLLPVLGFSFMRPLPARPGPSQAAQEATPQGVEVKFSYGGTRANGIFLDGELLVLQGSTVRKAITPSLAPYVIRRREKLLADGVLKDSSDPKYLAFTRDYLFGSPSAAADFVGGASLNGWLYWRVSSTDQILNELRNPIT